jgi:transcriptional regulator with XRE-family HTH domain
MGGMRKHPGIRRFGEAIRRHRRLQNITLEELAESIETDRAWLSRVERGEKDLSLAGAIRIAEGLGLTITLANEKLTS